jgi:hypothetical protein
LLIENRVKPLVVDKPIMKQSLSKVKYVLKEFGDSLLFYTPLAGEIKLYKTLKKYDTSRNPLKSSIAIGIAKSSSICLMLTSDSASFGLLTYCLSSIAEAGLVGLYNSIDNAFGRLEHSVANSSM